MKIAATLLGVLFAVPAFAQVAQVQTITPTLTGTSPALSSILVEQSIAAVTPFFRPDEEVEKADLMAMQGLQVAPLVATPPSNTVFQNTLGPLAATVTHNFQGLGINYNANWTNQGLYPPDTTMAVGPTQIIQWVNLRLAVMDKNGNALIGGALGYISGNAIWAGLPATSVCRNSNQGDPIVQYDRLADRWVLSQFAFTLATATSNGAAYPAAGSYRQCVAVSTTGDATGAYTLYEYSFTAFPDYGKLGVWPDGGGGSYVLTFNNFTFSTTTGVSAFAGASICGMDRSAALAGNTGAQLICTANMTNRFGLVPADLDGPTQAPSGTPNYVISTDWFFVANPPYSLRLQKFKPDYVTPANTTFNDGFGGAFNSFVQIPLGVSLIGPCADGGGNCVTQPGTPRTLDTLSMRPMYRLAYRNRSATEQSLVFTQTIDPPSGAVAGLNWMEIRSPGANPPVVFQNGTLNPPDAHNRWMGSAAMDKVGNIAAGYSLSSATASPSIRVAGRYRADIRNMMRGEFNVVTGGGSQTGTAGRWGDYSTMQIDPADDCTFWYTQEYYVTTSATGWSTRIVAFKFPGCQ